MRAKLTLRIDAQLIEDAKACAQRNGKSAADFFAALSGEAEPLHPDKTPLTAPYEAFLQAPTSMKPTTIDISRTSICGGSAWRPSAELHARLRR